MTLRASLTAALNTTTTTPPELIQLIMLYIPNEMTDLIERLCAQVQAKDRPATLARARCPVFFGPKHSRNRHAPNTIIVAIGNLGNSEVVTPEALKALLDRYVNGINLQLNALLNSNIAALQKMIEAQNPNATQASQNDNNHSGLVVKRS